MLERVRIDRETLDIPPIGDAHDDISIGDIVAFLRRYWPLIAATTVLSLCLAVTYVLTARPSYTATAQILIETGQPQTLLTQPVPESVITMDTPQVESQIGLLRSEQIAERVAITLKEPGANPEDAAFAQLSWLWRLVFGPQAGQASEEQAAKRAAIENIQNRTDVRRVGLSYVLEVSYRAADPDTAAAAANALSDAYVQDKLDTRTKMAQEGSVWLEERIEKLRHLMNQAALDEQEFKARRDYRLPGRSDRPKFSDVGAANPGGSSASSSSAKPAGEGQQIGSGASENANGQSGPTLDELESRAQTYRKIYESYLQAYTETVQRASLPGTNARVITRAAPPKKKSSPRTALVLAVALVFGMISGGGLALAHSIVDQTASSPRQIRRRIGLPLLGKIVQPHALSHIPVLWRFDRWWQQFRIFRRGLSTLTIVRDRPTSRVSLELKRAGIAVKAAARSQNAKVIGVVGAEADQDAAIFASNLALFNARSGTRTLLIDADLSSPKLGPLAPGQLAFGLSDVLAGVVAPQAAIVQTDDLSPSLLISNAGKRNREWTIEQTARFGDVLAGLRDDYDFVFVRLPAVAPGQGLSPIDKTVDGIVVISKAGVTTVRDLSDLTANLQMAGKLVLGIVIADLT